VFIALVLPSFLTRKRARPAQPAPAAGSAAGQ